MEIEQAVLFGGPLSGSRHAVDGPVLDVAVRGVVHRYTAMNMSHRGTDGEVPVYGYDGAVAETADLNA